MRYLLPLLLFASCASGPYETIHYKAVRTDCHPADGFGFDWKHVSCDSGTTYVSKRNIIKRTPHLLKVQDGQCTKTYAL